jgi:hypothetical protein
MMIKDIEMTTYVSTEIYDHKDSNFLESIFVQNNGYSISHNSKVRWLHIIDFDDTLFPTTWLINYLSGGKSMDTLTDEERVAANISNIDEEHKRKIYDIETEILSLLNTALSSGKVYILTAATYEWISYIIYNFLPRLLPLTFDKIKIYSARERYFFRNPDNRASFEWKTLSMVDIIYTEYRGSPMHIVGIGDRVSDHEALKMGCNASTSNSSLMSTIRYNSLSSLVDYIQPNHIHLHFLKFYEHPRIESLLPQLKYADEVYLKNIYIV